MRLLIVLFLLSVLCGVRALEREQEAGGVEDASERTTQIPVVDLQPKGDKNDSDSDEDGDTSGLAKCSSYVCRVKCQINGCIRSQCLDDNRCSCYCPLFRDPFDQFFKSILTSHLEPGLTVRRRPTIFFPSFGLPAFGGQDDDGLIDFRKLFEEAANSGSGHAKVYRTMQQTCRLPDDCSAACTNCTQTTCDEKLCRCSQCTREGVESRSTNVLHTCRSAHNCAEHCKGCVVTSCRYGVCECSQCSVETDTPTTSEVESGESAVSNTTQPALTTVAPNGDEVTTPVVTTEILTVRTNETLSAAETGHSGKCIPKRCNHSCWERQCTKWKCDADRCVCDGCPEEVSVVVKNVEGKPEKLQEDNNTKYEIIF
ncbi:uncharacterized protein LOC111253693 [Varroa destructor]|uniref:Uncharacterized protein n=1 Tax=Varroa destructor TaxID=109461 RepID=A0A7M7MDV7_VARDE|nr:uncharacterized protein LOC111253693 [Varroa destructor]